MNHFQFHRFALIFACSHSISLFYTDLGLITMPLTDQNAEIVGCILLNDQNPYGYLLIIQT